MRKQVRVAAERLESEPELPYSITPHIEVEPLSEGGMRFRFGRSLQPGMIAVLCVAALGGALGTWLLSLVGAREGLVMIVGGLVALIVTLSCAALWRTTTVVARYGSIQIRTEYLPKLGFERKLTAEDISSLRRHPSPHLAGRSVYQIRAHLEGRETFPVGHGIKDKLEAASIAAAMERALRN